MIPDWISRNCLLNMAGGLVRKDKTSNMSAAVVRPATDPPEIWEPAEVLQNGTLADLPARRPYYEAYELFDRE